MSGISSVDLRCRLDLHRNETAVGGPCGFAITSSFAVRAVSRAVSLDNSRTAIDSFAQVLLTVSPKFY